MSEPTPPEPTEQKPGKKSWLSTNDWLGVAGGEAPPTPPPEELSDQPTDGMSLPDLGPESHVQFGREPSEGTGTLSSQIVAASDLADLTAAMPQPDEYDDDEAIDLATPPGGATTGPPSLSKILKATGTKSDILRGGKGEPDELDFTPTGPASGWHSIKLPPKTGGSRTDIGGPTRGHDEPSDIFSGARSDGSAHPSGTGSNLLPGMSGIGRSSVFNDPSRGGSSGIGGGAESDLFAGLSVVDRGSSLYDDSARKTQKVPRPPEDEIDDPSEVVDLLDLPDAADIRPFGAGPPSSAKLTDRLLAGLADSGGMSAPDYNATDKSQAGSNLFDDVTAMDIDLGADPGASGISGLSGASGLNWLDPNRAGAQDSGPGSSIFLKPASNETDADNQGLVDFSQIPLMGSTDDPADQVKNSDLAGPASSVLKREIEKAMAELTSSGSVSFDMPGNEAERRAAWGTAQHSISDQMSMRMPVEDDELDLISPAPSDAPLMKKPRKDSDSVFDDGLELPAESGILVRNTASMSGSILQGMTKDKLAYAAENANEPAWPKTRPASDPDTKLRPRREAKRGSGLLTGGLALLVGAGGGAAAMYFAKPAEVAQVAPPPLRIDPQSAKLAADLAEANKVIETSKADLTAAAALKTSADALLDSTKRDYEAAQAQTVKDLEKAQAELKLAKEEPAKLMKKAEDDLAAAMTAKTAAEKAAEAMKADTETAKADALAKAKALEMAKAAADDAAGKLKLADAALDAMIAQLKAAKAIDEKATREQAIAALPEASKKAVAMGGGTGPAAELAKELVALKEKSTKDLADANAKIATLDAATKETDAKIQAAVAAAAKANADKLVALNSEVALAIARVEEERRLGEVKLREQAEAHQQQVTAVRAGASVAYTDKERQAIDDAARSYGSGLDAYSKARWSDAEAQLQAALDKNRNDARYWYFLGLAKYQQGRGDEAVKAFKEGAILEARSLPRRAEIDLVFVNVQGDARRMLDNARP